MALVVGLSDDAYERLHAGSPPRTPEAVAAWAADERMQARNGTFELIEPPPGWEERLMVRWRAEREAFRRFDEGEPPRTAEEAKAREPYEGLLARIRDLPLAWVQQRVQSPRLAESAEED